MQLIKLLSIVLASYFRCTRPITSLIKRLLYLSRAQSKVKFSIPVSSQFDGELQIIGTGNITWGEHCRFGKDVVLETQGVGVIEIGNNIRINQGSFIVSHGRINIGSDVLVGEYCSIRDANHKTTKGQIIHSQGHDVGEITIGDDVWIGRGSVVLKNSFIENSAITGANSLVTKRLASNTINVGIPARQLKER